MPGRLRRLWAKRRRRAVTTKPEPSAVPAGPDAAQRIEGARRRLKQTIPPPQDGQDPPPE